MKRKTTALLLTLVMCVGLLPVRALADEGPASEPEAEAIEEQLAETASEAPGEEQAWEPGEAVTNVQAKGTVASGTCGTNVTWTLDDTGTLTIRGSGAMTDYHDEDLYSSNILNTPWRSYRGSIKKVVIGNGVTTIGDGAFYNCSAMTSVTIPGSVTSIGFDAFLLCGSLMGVSIPGSVSSIKNGAFEWCNKMTSVTLSEGIQSIGQDAFGMCKSLPSISIPSTVTRLEEAFENCTALKSISVASGNAQYCSENGIVFTRNKIALICYPAGKTETSYSISTYI